MTTAKRYVRPDFSRIGQNTRLGQTILMITHNPEAAAYAHRIATAASFNCPR